MRDYPELIAGLRDCAKHTCCSAPPATSLAADAIEELLAAVPQWISVEERLPEHYRVVLVIKDHPVDYLHGYEFAARLQNGEWSGNSRKVLYWMPLPEPPKGVE